LRDKLLALTALQKVDLDIAALRKSADSFPREISDLDKQLQASKSAVDAERNKLEDLGRHRESLEHTVAEDKDKVKKWEARLTEQRSTREYSALAREIDIAKKGQQTMSEEIAELARQATVQRELTKTKDAEFQTKTKDLVERIEQLKARLADVEGQIKGIDAVRGDVARKVDGKLLRQYDAIRKKRLPAIVAVTAPGTCGGCRMNIRPQMYNQLVASRGVEVCPSCSRMIYASEVFEAPAK
jgi:predicted  nucleic acid-binding Zn-ribbon protein